MVLADQNDAAEDLDRQMPIAEVISKLRQTGRSGPYLQKRLGRGDDANDSARREGEAVAFREARRLRQIEEKFAAVAVHVETNAAAMPVVPAKRHRPNLMRGGPASRGENGGCAARL